MKHAAIVPLIGGMALAAKNVTGQKPDFIVSWNAFAANESHLTAYLGPSVPRYSVDDAGFNDDLKARLEAGEVDLVTALCPCAGLSRLNTSRNPLSAGANAEQNQWMYKSANLVLEQIRPKVLLGENAPGLVQPKGAPVLENLKAIARRNGYSLSTVLTNSMVHGLPQNRLRSFYFFWRGDKAAIPSFAPKIPMMGYRQMIDEALNGISLQDKFVRPGKITDWDPGYRFILDLHGMNHEEFCKTVDPNQHVATLEWIIHNGKFQECMDYIEKTSDAKLGNKTYTYKLKLAKEKSEKGMGFYFAGSYIINPNGRFNTFAGKCVDNLTHPYENRYLNAREMMTIMRLPQDMDLAGDWRKSIPHLPQSVPVTTGEYFVKEAVKFIDGNLPFSNSDYVHVDLIRSKTNAIPQSLIHECF